MKFSYLIFFVVLLNFHRESVTLPIKGSTKFKLPKPLTSDTAITINGTMIMDNSLSVALSEKGGSHICELNYDVSTEKVSMTQLKDPKVQSEAYTLSEFMTPVKFVLHIEPKVYRDHSINFELNVNNSGPISIICMTDSFEPVNKIVVKGAESISSLHFQYDN
ncbi:PREDICTED: uncharacterized protein LOC106103539 [Papilio polytes]|uniref:uncharacterized protein LOC106103539 n=1 Tax=Papilio polytes TaxID=76194 RepID=UPI000676550F|nr:PREDICTED: uncharacterized protein LOC106103539 [Papilio polytes]